MTFRPTIDFNLMNYPLSFLPRRVLVLAVSLGSLACTHAATFDHDHPLLDQTLRTHVRDSLVDYTQLKARRNSLDQYLAQLSGVNELEFENWTKHQQLAFLINAYNAYTLQLVIDHYPIASIKEIGTLFRGPWDQPSARLWGRGLTLNDLEHQIIRVRYDEPRVHFALVCAARGCPPLRDTAYRADHLDEQLDDQARQFLANPQKNRVDVRNRTVHLSPIFKWYGKDFEKKHGDILTALKPFWPTAVSSAIEIDFRLRYTDYNWSLNDRTH